MRWTYIIIGFLFSCICPAQVIENPVFDRTDTPSFHIDKIEITKDTTFVYCSCSAEENSWANISPETYLEDVTTGEKYTIIKSEGLPFTPNYRRFSFVEKYNIKMSFPCIKTNNKLNFIENPRGEAFNVYGISQTECNDSTYKKYTLEKAYALSTSANYYNSIKNYSKAIENEEQALYIRRYWLGRFNEMYDHSLFMLGHYYSMLGQYDKAEKYLNECVDVREILFAKNQDQYVDALTMLATCYANQNNVTKAIQTYEQAIRFISKDNISYTRTKSLLAQAYYSMGDIPKAIEYTEDVVSINKVLVGERDEEYLYPLLELAKYYFRVNDTKVIPICERIICLLNQYYGKRNFLYLSAINLLSQYYILKNDLEKALAYANEYMELSFEVYGKESLEYGLSLNLLSQINDYLIHDYDTAIRYQLEYMSISKSFLPSDSYSNNLRRLADLFAQKQDFNSAIQYSNEAIKLFVDAVISEFGKMTKEQKYTLWQKNHFLFDTGYPFYVYMCKNDAYTADLYNNSLLIKGITSNDQINEKCSWEMVQEKLEKEDIAIEFIESYEQDSLICNYALVLKKGYNSPKMYRLFDTSQFQIILKNGETLQDHNIMLGQLIWGKLKEELDGVNTIYFSPAGLFNSIAIEDLPINNKEYYSEKYNIYRLSSTKELTRIQKHINYKKAILFGGLDYNSGLIEETSSQVGNRSGYDYLPNTKEEVELISGILKNNSVKSIVYKGTSGTELAYNRLQGQNFEILHLATHGEYIQPQEVNTMRERNNLGFLHKNDTKYFVYESDALSWSFLLLSGGNRLISRQDKLDKESDGIISGLEISTMSFPNLDLVVLSACKTALGYSGVDYSVLGLQRAFKQAGAKTIIMSLSKVDDEATQILMVEFYRNLMSGKTKHQSLRDAQKYLRSVDNGKYDDPKYWASFIMLDGLN